MGYAAVLSLGESGSPEPRLLDQVLAAFGGRLKSPPQAGLVHSRAESGALLSCHSHASRGLQCGPLPLPVVGIPVSLFSGTHNPLLVSRFACRGVPHRLAWPAVHRIFLCSRSLPSSFPAHGWTMLYVCPSVHGCLGLFGLCQQLNNLPSHDLHVERTVLFLGLMPGATAGGGSAELKTQIAWVSECHSSRYSG